MAYCNENVCCKITIKHFNINTCEAQFNMKSGSFFIHDTYNTKIQSIVMQI